MDSGKRSVALVGLGLMACHAHPRPEAIAAPPVERVGTTSVRVLPRDISPSPPSTHVEVLAAEPQPENPLPEYPAEALQANAGNARVVVRIIVSKSGGVVEV